MGHLGCLKHGTHNRNIQRPAFLAEPIPRDVSEVPITKVCFNIWSCWAPQIINAAGCQHSYWYLESHSSTDSQVLQTTEKFNSSLYKFQVEGVHPRTGLEDPEGKKHSCTLSLTLALVEGWWSQPRPGRFTSGKDLQGGWAAGPVWTSVENLVPTTTRSPDRPAHSESLNWLCNPAHTLEVASGNSHMCNRAGYCCMKSLLYLRLVWRRVAQVPPLSFLESWPFRSQGQMN